MEKQSFNRQHLTFFVLGFSIAVLLFTPLKVYSIYVCMFFYCFPLAGEILIALNPTNRQGTAFKQFSKGHVYPAHRQTYRMFMRNLPLVVAVITLKPLVIAFFTFYVLLSFMNTQDIFNRIAELREKVKVS